MRRGCSRRPCTTHFGNTRVAQRTRAATDDNGEAPLESDDGVHAPPANELVGKCVYVFAKRLTLSNGQIQNAADHQPLRNIEAIQAALSAEVIGVGISPTWSRGLKPIDLRVGIVDELGDRVAGKHLGPGRKPLHHLQLHRVIARTTVIVFSVAKVIELREGQQQLGYLCRRIGPDITGLHRAGAPGAIAAKRIGDQGVQSCHVRGILRQVLRLQLIDILRVHGQIRTLGRGIGHVQQQVPLKLALDVQVPLLHIGRLCVGRGR